MWRSVPCRSVRRHTTSVAKCPLLARETAHDVCGKVSPIGQWDVTWRLWQNVIYRPERRHMTSVAKCLLSASETSHDVCGEVSPVDQWDVTWRLWRSVPCRSVRRYMTSVAKCPLSASGTSRDVLLKFWLLTHARGKRCFREMIIFDTLSLPVRLFLRGITSQRKFSGRKTVHALLTARLKNVCYLSVCLSACLCLSLSDVFARL